MCQISEREGEQSKNTDRTKLPLSDKKPNKKIVPGELTDFYRQIILILELEFEKVERLEKELAAVKAENEKQLAAERAEIERLKAELAKYQK